MNTKTASPPMKQQAARLILAIEPWLNTCFEPFRLQKWSRPERTFGAQTGLFSLFLRKGKKWRDVTTEWLTETSDIPIQFSDFVNEARTESDELLYTLHFSQFYNIIVLCMREYIRYVGSRFGFWESKELGSWPEWGLSGKYWGRSRIERDRDPFQFPLS